jgi:hypothetical protein
MNTARRLTGLGQRRGRWTRDQIQVTDPEVMRRSIKGASIGNFTEWYDFGVYGYIATTIAYNVAISAFGGTTPLIAQALVSGTGNLMVPAYMLIVAGLVGAVTLLFMPEVAGRHLSGSGPSVESEQEARELAADVE